MEDSSDLEHVRHSEAIVCRGLEVCEAVQFRPESGLHLVHFSEMRGEDQSGCGGEGGGDLWLASHLLAARKQTVLSRPRPSLIN